MKKIYITCYIFRYAQYSHFKIYSESEYYKLEIDGYEGSAGDSLNDPWYGSNNSPFSTYNKYVSEIQPNQMSKVVLNFIPFLTEITTDPV